MIPLAASAKFLKKESVRERERPNRILMLNILLCQMARRKATGGNRAAFGLTIHYDFSFCNNINCAEIRCVMHYSCRHISSSEFPGSTINSAYCQQLQKKKKMNMI